jgi:hypothetical protein
VSATGGMVSVVAVSVGVILAVSTSSWRVPEELTSIVSTCAYAMALPCAIA